MKITLTTHLIYHYIQSQPRSVVVLKRIFFMAHNPTPSPLWNFPLPLVVVPSSNTIEQQQQAISIGHGMGERKQRTLRLSINARERRRMHDLNDALDELRSVVCIIQF
jgi:hypothetical protein